MQIVTQDKHLTFISEDPAVNEENKVQSFNWVDIETISFNYPKDKSLKKFSSTLKVIGGLLIGLDASPALNKIATIDIYLKNGDKITKEYLLSSIHNNHEFEQKILSYLKR